MKMISSIITMLLVSLLAVESKALSNEDLYKWCKSYVDQGFEIETITDAYCIGVFDGISSLAADTCTIARKTPEGVLYFLSIDRTKYSRDAAIQSYVNTIKNEPEKWTSGAHGEALEAAKSIAPCE